MMANQPDRKRTCAMIVDQDFGFGITLADRLATHGYQAVVVRSVETAIDECKNINPQAVFIGIRLSEPVAIITLQRLLRTIETTCPRVPVVTMGGRTSMDQAGILNGGSLCHVLLPIRPVELTHIGRLLQSELSAAAASPTSPSTESGPPNSWAVGNRSHTRAVHREGTTWIG